MQRSMKLGHCICDPRRSCPCDVFTNKGVCPCAGERPDTVDLSQVKLTEMVHNAGCASKISAGDLATFLSRLPTVDDPAIVSGLPAGDDAGIYRLADGMTLVQTVDVFTPCVDDPRLFGRICAANCLSDVYAMGGRPRTALSVLAFPSETLDSQIMYLMLDGAMEVLAEAGCSLIGGHSIKDEEIKLGFAITGTIDPDKAVALETARPGDVLVLTKPLGVGVLNFARQIGRSCEAGLEQAEASMATLNKPAAEAMNEVGVSACTDVTGFGLLGHLVGMVRRSGVTAQVYTEALPAFAGAVEALREGVVTGAIERNREFVGDDVTIDEGIDQAMVDLGFDAQTSGGLLIAVPQRRHEALLDALSARGVSASTIGRVARESEGRIHLTSREKAGAEPPEPAPVELPHSTSAEQEEHSETCCADVFGDSEPNGTAGESLRAFGAMMRSTAAPGKIDKKTKELINFSLVVMARCGPCFDIHVTKARKMGISQAELDEAAWCAIAMGGAPTRLFYQEALEKNSDGGKTANGKCCSQ